MTRNLPLLEAHDKTCVEIYGYVSVKRPDEYIRIAVQLAHDLPRLAEIRRTLRWRMDASPLMDAPRSAQNVEAVYRAMWNRWCTKN